MKRSVIKVHCAPGMTNLEHTPDFENHVHSIHYYPIKPDLVKKRHDWLHFSVSSWGNFEAQKYRWPLLFENEKNENLDYAALHQGYVAG